MYGEVEKVIFLASEITKEKEMELASRRNHEQLIRKEEELRLAGLDLKKRLEDTSQLRKEEKSRFGMELKRYTHVLNELPHSVITINNLGFILFFNRSAEKHWGIKEKEVSGKQVSSLFSQDPGSRVVAQFCNPALSKSPGLHRAQELILSNGRKIHVDILLIQTDLKEELNYSMVILTSL
jgi:PAS domain S-box-containing protein